VAATKKIKKQSSLRRFILSNWGGEAFIIPADYLVNSLNRIDSDDVKKIETPGGNREGLYDPHGYVILMGHIPDVGPLENGRKFLKPPPRTPNTVQFNMEFNAGGVFYGIENLIKSASEKKTVIIPDFEKSKDGLISIGYNESPYEDLFVYVASRKPVSYIRCGRKPETENPACRVYGAYDHFVGLGIEFSSENLDWYANQGGIDMINERIRSWQVREKDN